MAFRFSDRPIVVALIWLSAWMLFGFSLIESIHVAVDWWHGSPDSAGWPETFWLLLLPVLIVIYFRFFSIFSPACRRCLPPGESSQASIPSKR